MTPGPDKDRAPDTLPAPPERKLRVHKCEHSKAERRETVLEGTAPGRWEPCKAGTEGAFCDSEGRWQRWRKTGAEKRFSVHVHALPPGNAKKVSHVTTRFGLLPPEGIVNWRVEDGNLVISPAIDGIDLGLEVHLEDGDG